MILNCIVINNNAQNRLYLTKLVNNHPNLELINEFTSSIEAKQFIMSTATDLIITEIELPVLSGFDLMDIIKKQSVPPQVIVASQNESYGFKCYEYGVTDYIQVISKKGRFQQAITKAILGRKMRENFVKEDAEHIFIKSNLKKRKVYINDIKWVEALGDYVKLITYSGSYVILSTMKSFQKELPSSMFLRIHKSYIINLKKVINFDSKHVEIDGNKIPISRNKKTELNHILSNA